MVEEDARVRCFVSHDGLVPARSEDAADGGVDDVVGVGEVGVAGVAGDDFAGDSEECGLEAAEDQEVVVDVEDVLTVD